MANIGEVKQVIGPVVDVSFTGAKLPEILNALEIDRGNGGLWYLKYKSTWEKIQFVQSQWIQQMV